MGTVLIIDDEEKIRHLLGKILTLEGYEVLSAPDGKSGLKKLAQHTIEVVLCDVKLPDCNGVEMVSRIKEKYPSIEVVLLTAYGNIPDGVQAIKNGAFDYLTKGDDNYKIVPLVGRAMESARKNLGTAPVLNKQQLSFDEITGKSQAFLQSVELARKVAPTDTAILLTGETGTGKEIFAQAIHKGSTRASQAFVAINCAAFSKDLLESELFGHKAGSFTGATKDQKGLLEEAHNGTVFLDEIGEMALDLQAKVLRVLESGEFIKIGETRTTKVNVRLIAATNRNLEQEIAQGRFREDLYYRISVFHIHLPPLRERIADIEALALHFLTLFTARMKKLMTGIAPECLSALQQHTWKGNIRELRNTIERAVILAEGSTLQLSDLPAEIQKTAQQVATAGKQLSAFELASAEKLHIQKVLNYTNGNKTEAARLLNIGLTTLYRKIDEYKISV